MKKIYLLIAVVLIFDIFVWCQIVFAGPRPDSRIYGLDVGQGDSELVILPGNIKVLIDGGPDSKVLADLEKILAPTDRYLDLVMLSHPQLDHFAGLIDVLKRYRVGAFISNGQVGVVPQYKELQKILSQNKIPQIALAAADKIKYEDNKFDILWPREGAGAGSDPNEAVLVMKLATQNAKALFTADAGTATEGELIRNYNLGADILKVGHHGSKFSSSVDFLTAVNPKIAVIEVGKNSYGHPTPETLQRFAAVSAQIFRTDLDGTIRLTLSASQISIAKEK